MPKSNVNTKARILEAANKLFYLSGIKATSLDAIAEAAGVTKRTLYYHFRSKDDLITCYLEARDQPNLLAFKTWFDSYEGDLADRICAIFNGVADATAHPKWRGCGFQRTVGELANKPGHPAMQVAAEHKKHVEEWLCQALANYEITDPAPLARQISLLLEGAFAAALIHRDQAYIHSAGDAAVALIKRQTNSP